MANEHKRYESPNLRLLYPGLTNVIGMSAELDNGDLIGSDIEW